jgi:prepilin-type N-terminal cleavage/methylation domain-containing protein
MIHKLGKRAPGHGKTQAQSGFTLFEVILALALSTMLMALIGAALNLYLRRIEARRNDVEWAQLARSIFTMIGEDLRAACEYRPQDMSGALAISSASQFDTGALDSGSGTGTGTSTGGGGTGTGTGTGTTTGTGTGTGTGTSTGTGGSMFSSSSTTGSTSGTGTAATGSISSTGTLTGITAPGVNGSLWEVMVEASRPPRLDQLFQSYTGYSNVAAVQNAATPATASLKKSPQSDLKTVRYFLRKGLIINENSKDSTVLSANAQLNGAGLVRQELEYTQRVRAEQIGDTPFLQTGQVLIAPEVAMLEVRYFDGTTVLDTWEMQVNGQLPYAVEIRLVLAKPEHAGSVQSAMAEGGREFRQMIFLPTARPPAATTATTTTGTGTSTTGTSTGTSTGG